MTRPKPKHKPCWECAKQRRVCDAARPGCSKCERRGIQCPGYGPKPLKWLNPGQTRFKGSRARDEKQATSSEKEQEPVINMPLVVKHNGVAIVEAVTYYNEVITPDMVAIRWPTLNTPFFFSRMHIHKAHPILLHCIACSSLAHRILQTSHNIGLEKSAVLARKLQTYRGETLAMLAESIGTSGEEPSDAILYCMMVFSLTETQQCLAPTWSMHNDGLHAVLDAKGGLRNVLVKWQPLNPILRYFLVAEIFGSSTSPCLPLDKAEHLLGIVDLIPGIFDECIHTSVPCPARLMQDTIQITYRRSVSKMLQPTPAEDFAAMKVILDHIRAFSVDEWVQQIRQSEQRILEADPTAEAGAPDPSQTAEFPRGQQDFPEILWRQIGQIYQSAVALYCLSSLFDVKTMLARGCDVELASEVLLITESCRRSLLGGLKEVASGDDHLRKMAMWPLFVAGAESESDADGSRSFVLQELTWVSRALGTASPLVACNLLKKRWTSKVDDTVPAWDGMFDVPYSLCI